MRTTKRSYLALLAAGIAVFFVAWPARLSSQQNSNAAVRIDNDDIGGLVTSAKGPEAGPFWRTDFTSSSLEGVNKDR